VLAIVERRRERRKGLRKNGSPAPMR